MPFKSEAQRRKFYAMANRGEISRETVNEWEAATPKGKKLPERAKKSALSAAFDEGVNAALARYGVKHAGEEVRLQIPRREYHGYDEAWREAARRGEGSKRAAAIEHMQDHEQAMNPPLETQGDPQSPAESLAAMLQNLDKMPGSPANATKDPLDRTTIWGGATNPEAGDTASREPSFNTGLGNIGIAY